MADNRARTPGSDRFVAEQEGVSVSVVRNRRAGKPSRAKLLAERRAAAIARMRAELDALERSGAPVGRLAKDIRQLGEVSFGEGSTKPSNERWGWSTLLTSALGVSQSTVSKKKAEFEAVLGYEIPSYFETEAAAQAFVLDWARQCADPGARPMADAELSAPLLQKLDAFKRAYQRELDRTYELKVHAAALELLDKELLARLAERERRSEAMEAAWRGIYSKAEYQLLLKCLHADSTCDDAQYNEAFRLVREREDILLKADVRRPRGSEAMPRTLEELLARRR